MPPNAKGSFPGVPCQDPFWSFCMTRLKKQSGDTMDDLYAFIDTCATAFLATDLVARDLACNIRPLSFFSMWGSSEWSRHSTLFSLLQSM